MQRKKNVWFKGINNNDNNTIFVDIVQWVSGLKILGSKMIIFESILTTFEASFIFRGSWGSIKNWLELKIEPPLADLALLNPWNTLYKWY